jgi:hypothetical protein
MNLHLHIIGSLLILLALLHFFFPRYFNWKQELAVLSLINRQMAYVHTFFIAFILVLMGLLCLTSAADLLNTTLGKRISLGMGIFWSVRLYIQFFGYSPKLWKGKPLETTIHILFSIFWFYLSTLFFLIYLG